MFSIFRVQKYRNVLYSWPMILALALILFIAGRASWNMYEKEQEAHEKLTAVQEEHQTLKERHSHIRDDVERLQTDRGKEAAMRERFGVVKENEHVVHIVERDKEQSSGNQDADVTLWETVLQFVGL